MDPVILAIVFFGSNLLGLYYSFPGTWISPRETFLGRLVESIRLTSNVATIQEQHYKVFPEAALEEAARKSVTASPSASPFEQPATATGYANATAPYIGPMSLWQCLQNGGLGLDFPLEYGVPWYKQDTTWYCLLLLLLFVGVILLLRICVRKMTKSETRRPHFDGIVINSNPFQQLVSISSDVFQQRFQGTPSACGQGSEAGNSACKAPDILVALGKFQGEIRSTADRDRASMEKTMADLSERLTRFEAQCSGYTPYPVAYGERSFKRSGSHEPRKEGQDDTNSQSATSTERKKSAEAPGSTHSTKSIEDGDTTPKSAERGDTTSDTSSSAQRDNVSEDYTPAQSGASELAESDNSIENNDSKPEERETKLETSPSIPRETALIDSTPAQPADPGLAKSVNSFEDSDSRSEESEAKLDISPSVPQERAATESTSAQPADPELAKSMDSIENSDSKLEECKAKSDIKPSIPRETAMTDSAPAQPAPPGLAKSVNSTENSDSKPEEREVKPEISPSVSGVSTGTDSAPAQPAVSGFAGTVDPTEENVSTADDTKPEDSAERQEISNDSASSGQQDDTVTYSTPVQPAAPADETHATSSAAPEDVVEDNETTPPQSQESSSVSPTYKEAWEREYAGVYATKEPNLYDAETDSESGGQDPEPPKPVSTPATAGSVSKSPVPTSAGSDNGGKSVTDAASVQSERVQESEEEKQSIQVPQKPGRLEQASTGASQGITGPSHSQQPPLTERPVSQRPISATENSFTKEATAREKAESAKHLGQQASSQSQKQTAHSSQGITQAQTQLQSMNQAQKSRNDKGKKPIQSHPASSPATPQNQQQPMPQNPAHRGNHHGGSQSRGDFSHGRGRGKGKDIPRINPGSIPPAPTSAAEKEQQAISGWNQFGTTVRPRERAEAERRRLEAEKDPQPTSAPYEFKEIWKKPKEAK